jgi:hypothetical protein
MLMFDSNVQVATMDHTHLVEKMKQHLSGFARLNQLTFREKRNRLPTLSTEESLRQFLDLEAFAEASGSLTNSTVFSIRSIRHILTRRDAFRRLAEHA